MAGDFTEQNNNLRELIIQNRFQAQPGTINIGNPFKFGIVPLPFELENSDLEFVNPELQRSKFGTPIFSNLIIGDLTNPANNTYTDFDGNIIQWPAIRIDTVLFVVNMQKNIVKTAVQGRNGTVKEYVSDGDFEIDCTGAIVETGSSFFGIPSASTASNYPEFDVDALKQIALVPESVRITSDFLGIFDIDDVVIESITFSQQEGIRNVQFFQMKMVSDTPIELIL